MKAKTWLRLHFIWSIISVLGTINQMYWITKTSNIFLFFNETILVYHVEKLQEVKLSII